MNNPDNPLPFLKRFVSDSWSILNLIGAIALLLILLFYSPDQAVWSHAYLSDEPIRHPFGYAGAWATDTERFAGASGFSGVLGRVMGAFIGAGMCRARVLSGRASS